MVRTARPVLGLCCHGGRKWRRRLPSPPSNTPCQPARVPAGQERCPTTGVLSPPPAAPPPQASSGPARPSLLFATSPRSVPAPGCLPLSPPLAPAAFASVSCRSSFANQHQPPRCILL